MSKTLWRAAAGLATLLCLSGTGSAAERLSGQQIAQLFPGNFQAIVQSYTVNLTAGPDGSLVGSAGFASDTGSWSIHSGKLCIRMNSWMSGRTTCSAVIADAGWFQGSGVRFRKL